MRKNLVFALLLVLLVALVASLWVGAGRTRAVATALLGRAAPSASASGSASASAASSSTAVPTPSTSAAPKPVGPRKLSVVGLGWDALAPGLLAAGGLHSQPDSAFGRAEVEISFSVVSSMLDVEKGLASGSAAGGADLAALPLSELVASYERLRALEPRVFFVSGWSQGRARWSGPAPSKLPGSGSLGLDVSGGEDALAFALSILDLSGVALDRVKVGGKDPAALLHATSGDAAPATGDTSLTTRDASHLLPYVLVAPRPLLEDGESTLALFTQGWLEGSASLLKDRPQAASKIGTFERAPDALSLLQQLGNLEPTLAFENAELLGLSGRGAVTIDALLDWQSRTRREAHVPQAPSFDAPLVDGRVDTRLVRENPKLVRAPEPPKRRASTSAGTVLLELPQRKEDDARLIEKLGLLAAVFPRCDVRLTTDASRAKLRGEIVERAATRYDLDRSRLLQASATQAAGRAALLEVVRAP